MNIQTSQKTTTAFDVAMDPSDVNDLLGQALRAKLNLLDGTPGVTLSVALAVGADGGIGGTASIMVETIAPAAGQPAPETLAAVGASPAPSAVAIAPATEGSVPPASIPDAPMPAAPPSLVPGFAKAA